jgi:phosphate transport system substrate-binding protein
MACLASPLAAETVRIRGSTLAFERLSSLREALARASPDLSIDWTGYGSRSGIAALIQGDAELAVSSRELEDFERELLARLSIDLVEHVLALDGLAVIVHPSNSIESLSLAQLGRIVAGSVVGWHGVGGPDSPIRLVMPQRHSGEVRTLERLLVDPASSSVEFRETSSAVVDSVASDPRALGVVSMSEDRSAVKTVALRSGEGGPAVLPTVETVERGDYPLPRVLFLYRRASMEETLRRVVSFLLLTSGQSEVARAGLVSLSADRPILLAPSFAPSAPAKSPVVRVGFGFRGSRLDRQARLVLDEVASISGGEIWVTGHTEPTEEPSGGSDLSVERAVAVADYLRERGMDVARVDGRGSAEPHAPPETLDGRRENRRADVWILPRR